MSAIAYLQLDAQNDPIFASGTSLTDAAAVEQAVLTRLNLFLGEWWENLNLGLPVFQIILGHLASPRGQAAMQLAIRQNIEGAPYVTSVGKVITAFTNGQFKFSAEYTTSFGATTTVASNLPALSAAIAS
jgi:hypothetical protein